MKNEKEIKKESYADNCVYLGLFFSVFFTMVFLIGYLVGIKVGFTEKIIMDVIMILILPPAILGIVGLLLDLVRVVKEKRGKK